MRIALDGGYRIRSYRAGDKPALLTYADNRNVSRNLRDRFPYPYTPQVADWWLKHVAAEKPETSFVIATPEELIGGIGVELGEDIHHRTAEIGFWLGEPYWGRGIVTAAVKAFTPWAFQRFDLLRIWAGVFETNPASARVLEKAGYTFEGRHRAAVVKMSKALRHAAGNFYVNDKPTGAVVGQQPFGGARASGTNDKAGSIFNLLRWTSQRAIKETFVPPTDYRYPHMGEE